MGTALSDFYSPWNCLSLSLMSCTQLVASVFTLMGKLRPMFSQQMRASVWICLGGAGFTVQHIPQTVLLEGLSLGSI